MACTGYALPTHLALQSRPTGSCPSSRQRCRAEARLHRAGRLPLRRRRPGLQARPGAQLPVMPAGSAWTAPRCGACRRGDAQMNSRLGREPPRRGLAAGGPTVAGRPPRSNQAHTVPESPYSGLLATRQAMRNAAPGGRSCPGAESSQRGGHSYRSLGTKQLCMKHTRWRCWERGPSSRGVAGASGPRAIVCQSWALPGTRVWGPGESTSRNRACQVGSSLEGGRMSSRRIGRLPLSRGAYPLLAAAQVYLELPTPLFSTEHSNQTWPR